MYHEQPFWQLIGDIIGRSPFILVGVIFVVVLIILWLIGLSKTSSTPFEGFISGLVEGDDDDNDTDDKAVDKGSDDKDT